MIQKSNYEAPAVELFGISPKTSILTLSDGNGSQATNVAVIAGSDIFDDPKW